MGDGGIFEEKFELVAELPAAADKDRPKVIEEIVQRALARVPESTIRNAKKLRIAIGNIGV